MEEKTERQGRRFGKTLRLCSLVLAVVLIWQIAAPSMLEFARALSRDEEASSGQEQPMPDTAQGFYELAAAAIGEEDYDTALLRLGDMKKMLQAPESAEEQQLLSQAWLMEASIHILKEDFSTARTALDASLEADPAQAQALLLRAQLAIEGGDYQEAIADVNRYLKNDPTDTATRQTYAQLLEQAQQYEAAAVEYEALYRQMPDDESFRLNALRCLFLDGSYEEAINGFDDYKSRLPEGEADPYGGIADFLRAACLLQLEDYPGAIAGFRDAEEAGYDRAACLEQIGLCQFEAGNYAGVLSNGQTMFAMEDGQIAMPELAYQRLGVAALYLENYQQALDNLDQAEALMPGLEGNAYYRGVCLLALSRTQEAVQAFTTSIGQGYLPQFCYYNRGVCHVELEEYEQALEDMEQALKSGQDPDLTAAAQELKDQLAVYLKQHTTEQTQG